RLATVRKVARPVIPVDDLSGNASTHAAHAAYATTFDGAYHASRHAADAIFAAARLQAGSPYNDERRQQAALLRDIFGNLFSPVSLDSGWLTTTVLGLAAAIYNDRAFDRLPILADALEEAGCTDAA